MESLFVILVAGSVGESILSTFITIVLVILLCAFGVNLFRFIIKIIKSLFGK